MERVPLSAEYKDRRALHKERMLAAARLLAGEAEPGSLIERAFREYADGAGQADVTQIAQAAGLTYLELTRIIRARADGPRST